MGWFTTVVWLFVGLRCLGGIVIVSSQLRLVWFEGGGITREVNVRRCVGA
jgi:hypothetical protein